MIAHSKTWTGNYTPAIRDDGTCSWCGSACPEKMAAAIKAGATLRTADMKYGWPHKFYIDGAPGMLKFYSEHLQDASPESREVIERAMGLNFTFSAEGVAWSQHKEVRT